MAFKLEIKKSDGSVYWVQYFNNEQDAINWLENEKTKFYWDTNYTYTIKDITVIPTSEELKQKEYDEYYSKRQQLLTETDWTQLNDCALTPACALAFKEYRKQLRLLRKKITPETVDSIVWPVMPVIEYQDEYKKQGEI